MDYLNKIENIIASLEKNGHHNEANLIIRLRDAASTGTELLMSTTFELLNFINSKSTLKDLIGSDVKELKEYCKSLGLYIRG